MMDFETVLVFSLGVFVTIMTLAGVFLIGLTEAADPAHSRPGDLSAVERSMVSRQVETNDPPAS
jgi:hypothetical protein